MRKTVSSLLAVFLIAAMIMTIIPVSAAPGNQNFGEVKKISDSDINMRNGERDAAWDHALAIPVNVEGEPGSATGTAWALWSDTAFYFYVEVNDSTPVVLNNIDDGTFFNAWEPDSVEIFISVDGIRGDIEARTPGNFDDACWQFRIDREGMPSTWQRDGAWTDDFLVGSDFNRDRFEWAVKTDGNKYYTKFKITWLGAPKPGELGISLQINDRLDEFDATSPQTRANDISGSWDVDQFGYIVLIDEPAIPAAAEPEPDEEAPVADDGDLGAGGGTPEVAAPVPAPPTSDMTVFLVVIAIAAAAVFARVRVKVK
jgi:hypothetical protein